MEKSIKLLTLNISIFHENNQEIVNFLKEINADILCLQEVTRKVDKSALDLFISKDAIDNEIKQLSFSFYAPNWALREFTQSNFHGKDVFHHEFKGQIECGNYIKSRFKITEGKSIFVQKNFSYITDWEREGMHPGEEPRMVQIADLEISSTQKLRIINYHGIWSKDKLDTKRTISACQKIVEFVKEFQGPTIICGDFNLFPNTKSIKILSDNFVSLVDKYNVTSTRPTSNELSETERNVVDYIFTSKEIEVKNFKVINSNVSDHLPLLMEFGIK